jgi:hypothetical protein
MVDREVMVWWRDWYEKEVVEQWVMMRPLYRSNQLPDSGQINCLIDTLRGILIYGVSA